MRRASRCSIAALSGIVGLSMVPAHAAEQTPSPSRGANVTAVITETTPSVDMDAPAPFKLGEVVKGRLGVSSETGRYHYWKIELPAGSYRVVMDAKRADDRDDPIGGNLTPSGADGRSLDVSWSMNELGYRARAIFDFESSGAAVVLRYENLFATTDYWLGLFRKGEPIPSPFFARPPKIEPLTLGTTTRPTTLTADAALTRYGYYSIKLAAGDYRVTAVFTRSDGQASAVGGAVNVLGPDGDTQRDGFISVNEHGISHKGVAKLPLADEATVIFKIAPMFTTSTVTLLVEKWPDQQDD